MLSVFFFNHLRKTRFKKKKKEQSRIIVFIHANLSRRANYVREELTEQKKRR